MHAQAEGFHVKVAPEGKTAPDFTLKTLDGASASLSDYRGDVVLVHFWASWCAPCVKEFPAFNSLAKRFGGRGLTILAVAADSRSRVAPFAAEHAPGFPILIDQYGSVMRKYRVGLIPSSIFVGRDGLVKGVLLGPGEYDTPAAVRYFEELLAQEP